MDEVSGIALARALALVTDYEKTHWQLKARELGADTQAWR